MLPTRSIEDWGKAFRETKRNQVQKGLVLRQRYDLYLPEPKACEYGAQQYLERIGKARTVRSVFAWGEAREYGVQSVWKRTGIAPMV